MLGGPRGPQVMYIHVTGFMLKCEATVEKLQEEVLCRQKMHVGTFPCVTVEFR